MAATLVIPQDPGGKAFREIREEIEKSGCAKKGDIP
jgi:hypothetical protein